MVAAANPLALAALYAGTAALVLLAIPILAGLCALVALEWTSDAVSAAVSAALRSSGAVRGDVLDPEVRA